MKTLLGLILFYVLAACGGDPDDARLIDKTTDASSDAGVDAATPTCDDPPPTGGVVFGAGGMTVYPRRCGEDPSCTAPICYVCFEEADGPAWKVLGNEQCRPL